MKIPKQRDQLLTLRPGLLKFFEIVIVIITEESRKNKSLKLECDFDKQEEGWVVVQMPY